MIITAYLNLGPTLAGTSKPSRIALSLEDTTLANPQQIHQAPKDGYASKSHPSKARTECLKRGCLKNSPGALLSTSATIDPQDTLTPQGRKAEGDIQTLHSLLKRWQRKAQQGIDSLAESSQQASSGSHSPHTLEHTVTFSQ